MNFAAIFVTQGPANSGVPVKTGRHGLRRAQSCRGRPYGDIWTIFRSSISLFSMRPNAGLTP